MTEPTAAPARGKTRAERASAGAGKAGAANAAAAGRETFDALYRTSADALSENYGAFVALNKERMETTMKAFENLDGAGDAGRKTMAAWLAGGRIAAEGWGEIAGKMVGCVATTVESGVSASEKALGCKDMAELAELQAGAARSMAETWLTESRVMSELALKTAAAAAAPIAERMNEAVEGWGRPAA